MAVLSTILVKMVRDYRIHGTVAEVWQDVVNERYRQANDHDSNPPGHQVGRPVVAVRLALDVVVPWMAEEGGRNEEVRKSKEKPDARPLTRHTSRGSRPKSKDFGRTARSAY